MISLKVLKKKKKKGFILMKYFMIYFMSYVMIDFLKYFILYYYINDMKEKVI